MHELSIAMNLLDQVLQVARDNHAVGVKEVEVEIGLMWQVDPEALEMAFSAAGEGTLAEGASLRIVDKAIVMKCENCQRVFEAGVDCFVCPDCNLARTRVVEGNDIVLRSVVCSTAEGVSSS